MKIIVCGAGQVGTSIARQLSKEDNDVTVIDQDPNRIRQIDESLDVNTIVGYASHPTVLEDAGAGQADMIIAVTVSDEINMVACQIAHSLFNVPVKIARVRHQNYLLEQWKDLYRHDRLPIDVIISPEIEVAHTINNRLHVPGAVDTYPFANGAVRVVSVRCTMDCPLLNIPLHKVHPRIREYDVIILGILRDGHFFIPHDKDLLIEGDEVFFSTSSPNIQQAMELFGHEEREARRIIIIGGGNIGLYLSQQLEMESHDIRVKIIELDKDRAEAIAQRLSRSSVINGNALEQEILQEANVAATETVIAVSNDDEVNILASLLAKRFGCQRAITLINRSSYTPLISSLGIDVIVNPRETTVSSILQHIRRGKIVAVHSICNGTAEIIEAEAVESSPAVGKTIKNLNFPKGTVIGAIVRKGEVIIPQENTTIQANDHVVMLCMANIVKEVEAIFSIKFEYF